MDDTSIESLKEQRSTDISVKSVKKKAPGLLTAFKRSIFAKDLASTGRYVYNEVVRPMFKKTILDTAHKGLDYMVGGTGTSARRSSPARFADEDRRNYTRYSREYARKEDRRIRYLRDEEAIDDFIIYETEEDAKAVYREMMDILSTYPYVRVADQYSISKLPVSNNYTLNSYGWNRDAVRKAKIEPYGDGWIIDLPKPLPIER